MAGDAGDALDIDCLVSRDLSRAVFEPAPLNVAHANQAASFFGSQPRRPSPIPQLFHA